MKKVLLLIFVFLLFSTALVVGSANPVAAVGTIFSNFTVSQLVFNQSLAQISFEVSGETGTVGYCNVTISESPS